MKRIPIIASLGLAVSIGTAAAQTTDQARIAHLLSRATFGVRPEDVAAAQTLGADKWLDQQLHPDRINDVALAAKLARFETLQMTPSQLAEMFPIGQQKKPQADSMMQQQPRSNPRRMLVELVGAKLLRATESNRQLEEMMTDFWFNHFNVFWGKGPDRYLVADYEQNAIRPYVFGSFYDMLRATAQHPAMLIYLDNAQSNALKGINENYARELMELHTLGVDGGYTQQDVQEVARAFTGWTVSRPGGRGKEQTGEIAFRFAPRLHDDGEKVILGHHLPAGRGIEDGEDVLRLLSRQPATAHHIARQLIQHFVTDDPPADYVNEIASVFLKTNGDLRAVTRALFTSSHFYDARYMRNKVKTPFELVASALRVTGQPPNPQVIQTLRSLGQVPYTEQAPTGFPLASADWVNSGAMINRMNFAVGLAQRARADTLATKLGAPEFQMK